MKTRLIQIGWVLLTLISLGLFAYTLLWQIEYLQNLPVKQLEGLKEVGLPPGVFLALNVLFVSVIYFAFFIVALLIMLRRAQERFSLLAAVVLLSFGTGNAAAPLPGLLDFYLSLPPVLSIPYNAFIILGWTLLPAFLILYPDGRFVPRWSFWLAVGGFVISAFWTTNPETFSKVEGIWAFLLLVLVIVGYGSIVYVQIWRYRHYYSPLQNSRSNGLSWAFWEF